MLGFEEAFMRRLEILALYVKAGERQALPRGILELLL